MGDVVPRAMLSPCSLMGDVVPCILFEVLTFSDVILKIICFKHTHQKSKNHIHIEVQQSQAKQRRHCKYRIWVK